MTEQGYPPRQPDRHGRPRPPQEPRRSGWQVLDTFDAGQDSEAEPPPWAVPGGIQPVRPPRRPRPAPDRVREPEPEPEPEPERPARVRLRGRSRAAEARRRRNRRRMLNYGVVLAVIAVVVVGIYFVTKKNPQQSDYVTTLQPGEYATVPNSCNAIGSAMLNQYLPGKRNVTKPPSNDAVDSSCNFQNFQGATSGNLSVTVQAFSPSLLAPPRGSATDWAVTNFGQLTATLRHPLKAAGEPPATVQSVLGLGDAAVRSVQVFKIGTVVTMLVRYRNVIITDKLQGVVGGVGRQTLFTLEDGAMLAAKDLLAAVRSIAPVGG